MAAKTFSITTRDNAGEDHTITIDAERAEMDANGRLVLFTGDQQVAAFVSVMAWHDTTAEG